MKQNMKVKENIECKFLIGKAGALRLRRRRRSLRRTGGKVAFIDADYFTRSLDTSIGNVGPGTAAHEFGHLAGLPHSTGLMQNQPGGILWMNSRRINSNQLTKIHNIYKVGLLNQGSNWEYQRIMSPAAGGYINKKMPFRGAATPYVNY